MKWILPLGVAATLAAPLAHAQSTCEDTVKLNDAVMECYRFGPELAPPPLPEPPPDPFKLRLLKYAAVAVQHRLAGLASYYSASLEGTLTANGERYHRARMTAAHLTLPLGTIV